MFLCTCTCTCMYMYANIAVTVSNTVAQMHGRDSDINNMHKSCHFLPGAKFEFSCLSEFALLTLTQLSS